MSWRLVTRETSTRVAWPLERLWHPADQCLRGHSWARTDRSLTRFWPGAPAPNADGCEAGSRSGTSLGCESRVPWHGASGHGHCR